MCSNISWCDLKQPILAVDRHVTKGTPRKFFIPPLEKCFGYSLKLLDTFQKISTPLRKLFSLTGVSRWLRVWLKMK